MLNCNTNNASKSGQKTILIIGASFAGILAWRNLHSYFNVIIVDKKSYYEMTPSIIYCLAGKTNLRNVMLDYREIFKKNEFICGKALELKIDSCLIQTQENTIEIKFDYCIIATGGSYIHPIKANDKEVAKKDRLEDFYIAQNQVKAAKNILVIGSGAVGVELASELRRLKKNVSMITRSNAVLTGFSKSAQIKGKNELEKRGIAIQFGKTKDDINLKDFDLIYECVGYSINSDFMKPHLAKYVDTKGGIRVNDYLQLLSDDHDSITHIFAVGDVCKTSINEEKVVLISEIESTIATENIKLLAKNIKPNSRAMKKIPKSASDFPRFYLCSIGDTCLIIFENICIVTSIGLWLKKFIEITKMLELKQYKVFIWLYHFMHYMMILLHNIYTMSQAIRNKIPFFKNKILKSKGE